MWLFWDILLYLINKCFLNKSFFHEWQNVYATWWNDFEGRIWPAGRSLETPAIKCCDLSGGIALIVWFTTSGMCMKNNTTIYVVRASNSKRDCEHALYCCLLPRCETLRTCRSGFPIATKWCCDQDVEVVPSSAFTQRTCDRCGSL